MDLQVTAFVAGLAALWLIFLQTRVIGFRWRRQVSLGDGGHAEGERLIRAHGNAAETIPVFLILLGLAESMGAPGWSVALLGAAFLIGRLMHGLHFVLDRPGIAMRSIGMVLTISMTALAALGVIGHALAG